VSICILLLTCTVNVLIKINAPVLSFTHTAHLRVVPCQLIGKWVNGIVREVTQVKKASILLYYDLFHVQNTVILVTMMLHVYMVTAWLYMVKQYIQDAKKKPRFLS
jgi:hypothetical protein